MNIAELMTRDVTTIEPEATLRELASLLATEHIGGVPVVRGEQVIGVVSAADLLTFDADAPGAPTARPEDGTDYGEAPEALDVDVEEGEEIAATYFAHYWEDAGADVLNRIERTEGPEWSALDEHFVSEIMSEGLFTLPPETEVREAARRMLDADVHRALVMADGELLGVVTTLDFLSALAEHGLSLSGTDRNTS